MLNYRLKRAAFCLLLAPLMLTASCTSQTASQPTTSQTTQAGTTSQPQDLQTVRFTLSWLLQGVDAPLTTAIQKGYFAEEGVQVNFERGYGSADSINKIAAGQYDLGFGDLYSMIEFNEKNPDQKLIAIAVPYNNAPFAIIGFKKNGINTPQDLAGKTLGAPAGDAPRRLWPVFAKEVGIDPTSVNWTTMEPKLRETFLLQGDVDAISGFSYSALPGLIKGGANLEDLSIFYYTDHGMEFYGNAIITTPEFLEKNPEVVRSFLSAYVKGLQDTLRDPTAGLQSVIDSGDSLIDRESEKLRLQIAVENLLVNEEVEARGLGDVDPERLEKTIAQVVEGFGLQNTPPVQEVYDSSYLPALGERQLPPAAERKSLE